MSEINANIIVETSTIDVQVEQSEVGITVEPINLNVYSSGYGTPGGNIGELQYNAGILAGIPNVTYSGGNLSLGNVANVKILGGSANFALVTDGSGNLSWSSIANANYASFANVANTANVALSVAAANIVGTVANANYAAYAGNVTIAAQSNITSLGTLTGLTVNGTSNLSNVGNVKITGGTNGQFLQTDGTGNLSWVSGGGSGNGVVGGSNTQVQYNNAGSFGGSPNFTFNNTSNVVAVNGNVTATNFIGKLSNSAVVTFPYGTEKVGIIGAQTGTYNFDVLTNSIQYSNVNATANLTLNLRGNSTTTLSSLVAVGESITSTYLMTTGTTGYAVGNIEIDGVGQTIRWAGNVAPSVYSNTVTSYTFTALKVSSAPSYLVLGSFTRYG